MHVDNAEAVALLVIRWRNHQPPYTADNDQYQCRGPEPGLQTRADGIEPLGGTQLVNKGPHALLTSQPLILMRSDAAIARGARLKANASSAPRIARCASAPSPKIAACTAPAPKINTGIKSGSTSNDSSTPPRDRPTVSAAPIAPIDRKSTRLNSSHVAISY